jgi:hypothetical protein
VRPFAAIGDGVVATLACADWEAQGYNGLSPSTCLLLSHFDSDCGCPNVLERSDELVVCDLCGTGKRVNTRYVQKA